MKHFFATLLLLFISTGIYCQLGTKVKEFNRGRLQIPGLNYGNPYTMFDTHNGKTFEATIDSIKSRIKSENNVNINLPIALAYSQIYDNTQEPMPGDNGMPYDKVSELALWAKNNAFVMLVGLDKFGNELTLDKRDTIKLNVLKAFDALEGEINNTTSLILEVYDNLVVSKRFKFFARSHILWLQAYDLLKASAALPELSSIKYADNYDSDANISWYSPRNKLRLNTRNLYKMSNGPLGLVEHAVGWKKNHGIACASASLGDLYLAARRPFFSTSASSEQVFSF